MSRNFAGVTRELHLLAFGNTRSAGPWRHPAADNTPAGVRRRLIAYAQTAEAGTFDALFFADGLNYGPPATWAYKITEDFEPLTATAALSSVTEHIGLVVTGSATLAHPYHLARQLLSLDHLSGGRAGWNLVTSFARAAADNFSARGVIDHDDRYAIAEEALEVVRKLWDEWGEDTIVEDRPAGIFNDVAGSGRPTITDATSTSQARSARRVQRRGSRCSSRPDPPKPDALSLPGTPR